MECRFVEPYIFLLFFSMSFMLSSKILILLLMMLLLCVAADIMARFRDILRYCVCNAHFDIGLATFATKFVCVCPRSLLHSYVRFVFFFSFLVCSSFGSVLFLQRIHLLCVAFFFGSFIFRCLIRFACDDNDDDCYAWLCAHSNDAKKR